MSVTPPARSTILRSVSTLPLSNRIGKQTEMVARFSTVAGERGGAEPLSTDAQGRTAAEVARANGYPEVANRIHQAS